MDELDATNWLLPLLPSPSLAFSLLLIPVVLYVVARWRGYRDQVVDPQLGLKVALSFFALIALQVLLAGVTTFFYAFISTSDHKGDTFRLALGLIVPGGIVFASHAALLARTNQRQFPSVRRVAVGATLLITGLFGFAALVIACEALFKGRSWHDLGRVAGAGVLVYGTAWTLLGVHLSRLVNEPFPMPATPPGPPAVAPPGGGPAKPEPGLPSLGKGAFPPIQT